MMKSEMRRLVGRFLMLTVLVASLAFVSVDRKANAAACCSACQPFLVDCLNVLTQQGVTPDECFRRFDQCRTQCTPDC